MKGFSKFLALGAVLAASSSFAFADKISAAGGDTFTNTTITFTGPYLTTGDTGVFQPVNGGTLSFVSGALNYTTSGTFPGQFIFNASGGGSSIDFYVTSTAYTLADYDAATVGAPSTFFPYPTCPTASCDLDLSINGTGYFTGTGISGQLPGTFTITTQGEPSPNGDSQQVTFSGTGTASFSAVTPEPNSLVLLGTGLFGAAGTLFKRRRQGAESL